MRIFHRGLTSEVKSRGIQDALEEFARAEGLSLDVSAYYWGACMDTEAKIMQVETIRIVDGWQGYFEIKLVTKCRE